MSSLWQVTPEKIQSAVNRVVEAFDPRKIILFGSCARGAPHEDSDLDLLVVMKGAVDNPRQESVRIRRTLKGLMMAVDIVVIDQERLSDLAEAPGLIYREALRTGRIVYESAT